MKGVKIGLAVLGVLLCFSGRSPAFTTHNTMISRSFDKLEEVVGGSIRVTLTFSNLEATSLRGFFYSDHIPDDLTVSMESVTVNGAPVTGYTLEQSTAGDVWPGSTTHRWILETPISFAENNPISSGGLVEIVYLLSSPATGTFELNEFNWAGYYPDSFDAAFGHSETSDSTTLEFLDDGEPILPGDLNFDGAVDLIDAILGLQVCAGMTPSSEVFVEADVNEDGVLGIADVIFILQTIGGLR